jgi:hypothetical protein
MPQLAVAVDRLETPMLEIPILEAPILEIPILEDPDGMGPITS